MSNSESSSSGTKAQKINPSSANFLDFFAHQGEEHSSHMLREMIKFLSLEKIGNLMTVIVTAAKDTPAHRADVAKIVLLRAPPVWDNNVEVRQLFVAMALTPTTLWKNWIITSKVKKMMVGVDDWSNRANVVTDEWLSLIDDGKFPQLNTLNLS